VVVVVVAVVVLSVEVVPVDVVPVGSVSATTTADMLPARANPSTKSGTRRARLTGVSG
jgi:hypothetical protein